MRPAEELRYLILAIQREGYRLLATELRPLGVTPSQAEVLRVLGDHQPLSLIGLGELLVCETGGSPSRLVDRLVANNLVGRSAGSADRRQVVLTLTGDGERIAPKIAEVEQRMYQTIDDLTAGTPMAETLTLLRAFAGAYPAGQALARRADKQRTSTS